MCQTLARPTVQALVAILVAAALVRLPGMFNDFWLDEIWTYNIVGELGSLSDVFTTVRHSNNHHLNTVLFYLLGDQPSWSVYRIPSLLAGIGIVAMTWVLAIREGRTAAWLASGLTAASYLLIHFSSEARGYTLVVFFCLVSYWAARDFLERRRWRSAVWFWCAAILGWVSHLSYAHLFVAVAVWSVVRLRKEAGSWARVVDPLARLFAVPALFCAAFYAFEVRLITIHGGPDYQLLDVLTKTLSYAWGGPAGGGLATLVALVTVALLVASIVRLARQHRDEWILFATVIFGMPAVLLVAVRPEVLFVRYFLISIVFGYLAVSPLLAQLLARSRPARVVAGVLLGAFLIGNAWHVQEFFRYGRGDYQAALRYIVQNSSGSVATLTSDDDFRNFTVIHFYRSHLRGRSRIDYIANEDLRRSGADWILIHRTGELGEVDPAVGDPYGNPYVMERILPSAGLSGWHWILYQRAGR